MTDHFDDIPDEARDALRQADQPRWTEPMLATLTHDHFSSPDWIYERKLDGERALVFRKGDDLRILSRNQKQLNDTYPELEEALADQPARDFIADGEIVAFKDNVTSFSRLQQRMKITDRDEARRARVAVYFYLFDILHLDGHDTTRLPLRERKRLLRAALRFDEPLRFTPHRNQQGEKYLEEACRKRWEGLIAKRADSPYRHTRSKDWLKFKCVNRQELVIGGFTPPQGERPGLGAIVVGYHEDGELVCAGKVGTGFDDQTLSDLANTLKRRERETSPFDRGHHVAGHVHWVTPELVAEIGFTEWTSDGALRHPRFLGLRDDKPASEVVREQPEPAP